MRIVRWDEFEGLVSALAFQIGPGKYKYIYGIPRGGSVVAVLLSHMLNKPVLDVVDPHNYIHGGFGRILVVDDISDSGGTLKDFAARFGGLVEFDTATVFTKPGTAYQPTFTAAATDEWIRFPWETGLPDTVSKVRPPGTPT